MLRLDRRRRAFEVVWDEYDNGVYSPESIAEAYRAVTVRSQIDAHLQALKYSEEENLADNARSGEWEGPISSRIGKGTKSAFRSVVLHRTTLPAAAPMSNDCQIIQNCKLGIFMMGIMNDIRLAVTSRRVASHGIIHNLSTSKIYSRFKMWRKNKQEQEHRNNRLSRAAP
jgi:hypothetical protein